MESFKDPQLDEVTSHFFEYVTSNSDWSPTTHSIESSPLEGPSSSTFSTITNPDTPHPQKEHGLFEEATQALKLHKDAVRKVQNRAA